MNKPYLILAAVLILLGAGIFLLPDNTVLKEVSPQSLLRELNTDERFWSTDIIAEKLIDKDPNMLLVDVRDMYQYLEYSLPTSVNIPLEEVLDSAWVDYFRQDDYDVVLFSNGDILADQAWLLLRRKGYRNLYIMKGGLNRWAETILQPVPPVPTEPQEAFELYSFRKGASIYFGGSAQEMNQDNNQETITVTPRKKKTVVEGGC
jgi:rhodanese-related sulfurtransferase